MYARSRGDAIGGMTEAAMGRFENRIDLRREKARILGWALGPSREQSA
jgi:hypothetical protein